MNTSFVTEKGFTEETTEPKNETKSSSLKFDRVIYDELLRAVSALPKEAVETASKEATGKGYDTTGYQYQFLVNILNEMIGLCNWSFDYKIIKEIERKWSNGKPYHEITAEITIEILGIKRTCVGGHRAELYFDALKGAITNGFKKTLAFFGVGKKAYEGTLDDDYMPISAEPMAPMARPTYPNSMPTAETQPTTQAPDCPKCGAKTVWKAGVSKRTNREYAFWGCPSKDPNGTWCGGTVDPKKAVEQNTSQDEINIEDIPF